MQLREFRIQNYRSVVDSGIVDVADITALIGANEAGKSSLLEGLNSISMDSNYQYFDLTQLNGVLKKFNDLELLPVHINIVWTKFELSTDDSEEIQTIVRKKDEDIAFIELSKYFNETYRMLISDDEYYVPSQYLVNKSLNNIRKILNNLREKGKGYLEISPNNEYINEFSESLETINTIFDGIDSKTNIKKIFKSLDRMCDLDIEQNFKDDIDDATKKIYEIIDDIYPNNKTEVSLYYFILSNMPRTVYFKTYERLEDDVSIKELQTKSQSHRTFNNFLVLAELKLETIERLDDEIKRQVYIESGCGRATKLLRDAWKQEELDVKIRYSDGRLMVFTKNSKAIETLLPPSLGSEGFQWFLGFYINFGAATNAEYKRAILLLDDPGVFLHPKGHKDLLKLFEGYLERDVTTIYSTHLPFLIPKENLKRLRLVQKGAQGHTEVTGKFYSVEDKDILFPLRAALGVTLSDSLFIGNETIVAEGLSERILLYGVLTEFNKREIKKIDLQKMEILAGEGARGVKNYALMLQIENLPYIVVLDNDGEGRKAKKDFLKDGIPDERMILLPAVSTKEQKDYDIEDMFALDIYAEAFYNVHGEYLSLSKEKIIEQLSKGNDKLNNKAQKILKKRYNLDKVKIAYEILNIMNTRDKLDKSIVDNFTILFDEINAVMTIYS